jgi:hypothetical protein
MGETIFETVCFDEEEIAYRSSENGESVRFTKLLHIRFQGEVMDVPLSYTTYLAAKLPCVRIAGARYNLDTDGLEIASDCVIPCG